MKNILLLSNSTNPGENFLSWPIEFIKQSLEGVNNAIFIPYAGVSISYDEYTEKVNNAFSTIGQSVKGIHEFENPTAAIQNADAILVGGGNTFELLRKLYEDNILDPIREKVENGTPYIGWSAGSNIAGPSIKTTNDMPISFPPSFDALNLMPYQLNPHYTEATIPNHGGETRKMRLEEFLKINPESKVICLPEATFLKVEGDQYTFVGKSPGKILAAGEDEQIIKNGESIK